VIEAQIDRGPIVELIVKCPKGVAIISYSKIEKLYCSPRFRCRRALTPVLADSCGRH
jgi:hypothetical protein